MQRRLLVSDIGNCRLGTNTTTSLSASTVKSGTIVHIKKTEFKRRQCQKKCVNNTHKYLSCKTYRESV